MTHVEKLEVAEFLDNELKVDVIEAGFPGNGPDDFKAVSEISERAKNAIICGLARAVPEDVDSAGRAVKTAKRGRIHTFISTSPDHMRLKLGKSPSEVLLLVSASVTRARQWTDDVEWSAEDATRTERDFLCRCVEAAIRAGATTINIPDTVGYSEPDEYRELFEMLREKVPGSDSVRFSAHCHRDLGLAVANSLAALKGGARQIEGTIMEIGERAGNAALEQVVMAIKKRNDRFPFWTNVDTTKLMRAAKLISRVTAFSIPANQPIVGRNAFAHLSGIHQDGMIKGRLYEIMTPEEVGRATSDLPIGKHSGRAGLSRKVQELGYSLGGNQLVSLLAQVKELAAKKKNIYDDDIEMLIEQMVGHASDRIKLISLSVVAGTRGPQRATMRLDINGKNAIEECEGNGPVDAVFNCIKALVPHEAKLELYQVQAVTEETQAQAEVSICLATNGTRATSKGTDPDTLVASAKAYLGALNRLKTKTNGKVTS